MARFNVLACLERSIVTTIVVLFLITLVIVARLNWNLDEWQVYKLDHSKVYTDPGVDEMHRTLYYKRLNSIERYNDLVDQKKLKANKIPLDQVDRYLDLTVDEMRALSPIQKQVINTYLEKYYVSLETLIDAIELIESSPETFGQQLAEPEIEYKKKGKTSEGDVKIINVKKSI